MSVLGVLALIGAGAAGYLLLTKKNKSATISGSAVNAATIEGVDVEDALAVETPPADIPGPAGPETADGLDDGAQVDGDPWLDPETVEGAEALEGSGDFVEGEEPFEDVFDPSAGGYQGGGAPVSDPIDPSELPPPDDAATTEPPKTDQPQ